ncbi:PocR ligand-binding domain-containing protein [Paraburkholderia sp.]|uniref:PocR ligand-binding domain-containing protein n=1 Tax=Paraburkholderia sp. TaxID=1926495 RepID=UPI0025D91C1F|nr:PocR ligand-binding domain-containing protein [Paraburkholderia sp.]
MKFNKEEKPILFVRNPKLKKMRDPLFAKWNLELASQRNIHNEAFNLAELVDFSLMNDVFASFLEVVGLPVAIIDFNGLVLASSPWQRICIEFHRMNSGTLSRCLESDRSLSTQMQNGHNHAIYKCHNGLMDCAAPIVIEGQHIANIFIGQFFVVPPDETYFEAQCAEYGFNRDAYFKALSEVPIIAEEKIPDILKMLVGLATIIAKQSIAEHRARIAWENVEKQVIQRTKALADAKERLEAAASAGIVGVWDWDIANNSLVWDKVMYKLYGVREEDFSGAYELWISAIHPGDMKRMEGEIHAALNGEKQFTAEFRIIWPDKSIHYIKAIAQTTFDMAGSPVRMVGVNYDVTEQKDIQRRLDYLAFHDELTSLPNRRLLYDRADQAIGLARRENRKVALLFLDLDRFKQVNDAYGHEIGDWLLVEAANRIKECVRSSDTVARIGGDEFVVLLPYVSDVHGAVSVAEKIRASVSHPFAIDDALVFNISSSIGIALYPDHAAETSDLIRIL